MEVFEKWYYPQTSKGRSWFDNPHLWKHPDGGVLKPMGDPQVTMGFNTRYSQKNGRCGVPMGTILGNLQF